MNCYQNFIFTKNVALKYDWCERVKNDMNILNINLSENEIKNMRKNKFKYLVKTKVK